MMILERPGELRLGDPIPVPHGKDPTRLTRKLLREQYPVGDLMTWARSYRLAPKLVTAPVGSPDTYQTHLVFESHTRRLGELVEDFPQVIVADDPNAHGFDVFGKNVQGGWYVPPITEHWIASTYPIVVKDNDRIRWIIAGRNEVRRCKMWVTDNLKGSMFWGFDDYRFQHENDALLFKLRWM